MDTNTLVTEMIDDGKRILEQLAQGGFEITAALWLKKAEDSQWYFYIVSPLATSQKASDGYGRLLMLIRRVPDLWIDPIEVRLIEPSHPIAKDVLAIHNRALGLKPSPIRWGGNMLGSIDIEGAYLYPLPVMASS